MAGAEGDVSGEACEGEVWECFYLSGEKELLEEAAMGNEDIFVTYVGVV